ncbi:MAG TPA: transglutaminase domain-containing protein, partial [Thermomicrobiales bacterium]|nr:transglutaminase domain-containing protein [Thermomicrobiales bacterium]
MTISLPDAANPPSTADRAAEPRFRLAPAEGWLTLFLHAVILVAAALTVGRAPMAPPRADLIVLTLGGLLCGLLLAKVRAPDLLAHALSFFVGAAVAMTLTAEHLTAIGSRRQRLEFLFAQLGDWQQSIVSGQPIDDPRLFAIVLGLTVWLVAYTSAWVLYRRGWLATAVILPAAIATINLGYMPGGGTGPLLVIVAAGCVLAARHALFQREQRWRRRRMPIPARLPWGFLVAGVNLALVTALIGWTLPLSARDQVFDAAWEKLQPPVEAVNERWQDLMTRLGATSDGGGSYASFGDQFRLGGALSLSDDPVMVLRTNLPDGAYLAGHRYDEYTGSGWRSSVAATFNEIGPNGQHYSPQMSFASGQGVHLTPQVLTDRSQVTGSISVLRPKGDVLFTLDTFLAADRQADVALSWQQLKNQPYPLAKGDLRAIPVDLRAIASLLLQGRFPPGDAAADSPAPSDSGLAAQIKNERTTLQSRLLDVSWSAGADGKIDTMYVSGQLPVYDDVEAVFGAQPVDEGQTYGVVGLASAANEAALRSAGTTYPDWVTARYLQLPDTVTERTRTLAAQLAKGQTNPFDTAIAIQTYVRDTIRYNENIDPPPPDRDVVDYVLFDSQEGYCEYYASAMAVLLRMDGIPARVVGGYYRVPFDQQDNGFLYREKNAHLWVEVYFPGYGWIPFEPTASQQPLTYGETPPAAQAAATPAPAPTAAPPPAATPAAVTEPPTAAGPRSNPLANPRRVLGWAGLALLAALLLASLLAVAAWNLGFRGLPPTGGVWARVLRGGQLLGVPAAASLTPREYADRLGRVIPSAQGPARIVAELYTEERYAPTHAPGDRAQAARAAWTQLRVAF